MKSTLPAGYEQEGLLNRPVVAIKDLPNSEVIGVVGERRQWVSADGRDMEALSFRHLTDPKSSEGPFTNGELETWLDGGLRGAMKLAGVEPGAAVRVVFTGQVEHPENPAHKINQYEIFALKKTK